MLLKSKYGILFVIVIGVAAFAGMMILVGQGNVREDTDGQAHLKGVFGVDGEPNPHIVTRTNFAYILTVINNGEKSHRLYIEGLNMTTNLLEPGQQDILKIYPTEEKIYQYYDNAQGLHPLGFFEVRTVIPSDEFTGFFRDLI